MGMEKPTLSSYIRDHVKDGIDKEPGPFVTISRQFGCNGFEVADLLAEKLNKDTDEDAHWRVYKREILRQVAQEAGLSEEVIERERQRRPSFILDFFRSLHGSKIPDSLSILKSVTTIVRTIAFEGRAIIVGHGATAATCEIDNGLNIRIEAPRQWRLRRLCSRDGVSFQEAEKLIQETESGRKHLDKIYRKWNPRKPAFSMVFDNSTFTDEQIVEHVILAMEQKNLI